MKRGARLLFVLPIAFSALGTWQLCRYYKKRGQYEILNRTMMVDRDPIVIDRQSKLEMLTEGEPVILHGSFAQVPISGSYSTIFLGPRIPPQESVGPGLGYHIIKPFRLFHDGIPILVNLGWVSRDLFPKYDTSHGSRFSSSPSASSSKDPNHISDLSSQLQLDNGKQRSLLAIATEKDERVLPEWYGPVQRKNDVFFFYSQRKEMGDALGLPHEQPFIFKVIDSDENSQLIIPNAPEPARVVPHLQYMATWFVNLLMLGMLLPSSLAWRAFAFELMEGGGRAQQQQQSDLPATATI